MKDHLAFSFFFDLFHLECDGIQFLCEEEEEEEKNKNWISSDLGLDTTWLWWLIYEVEISE